MSWECLECKNELPNEIPPAADVYRYQQQDEDEVLVGPLCANCERKLSRWLIRRL